MGLDGIFRRCRLVTKAVQRVARDEYPAAGAARLDLGKPAIGEIPPDRRQREPSHFHELLGCEVATLGGASAIGMSQSGFDVR